MTILGERSWKPATIAVSASLSGDIDEVYTVFNDASGGTFTFAVKVKGLHTEVTAAIDRNANAAAITSAIELLTTITGIGVTGAGTSGDPWIITFDDPGGEVVDITADDANLTGHTGGTNIVRTTQGQPAGLDVLGWDVVAIEQAASCEGSVFTAQGSLDGETFVDIQDGGGEWSVAKSASLAGVVQIPEDKILRGYAKIRIRSGTSVAPVVQVTAVANLKVGLARP